MAQLYGIIAHADLRKVFKESNRLPFCYCCRPLTSSSSSTPPPLPSPPRRRQRQRLQQERRRRQQRQLGQQQQQLNQKTNSTAYTNLQRHQQKITKDQRKQQHHHHQQQQETKNQIEIVLHDDLVNFLRQHHLSVLDVEKRIQTNDGLCGRVDCIFRQHNKPHTLFIVDWKFTHSHMPKSLSMDQVMQLNLYRYIMHQMATYAAIKTIEMFCLIFSGTSKTTTNKKKLKIFKVDTIPEEFLRTLITKTSFSLK